MLKAPASYSKKYSNGAHDRSHARPQGPLVATLSMQWRYLA
jgi:hypothetical protein